MAEILKDWLKDRLNRSILWDADDFADKMKNGHVISEILMSYHVINQDKHYLIKPSNSPDDMHNNWKYLVEWLHFVEIYLTDEELKSITSGSSSALLRLFYKLFLHLDKKDRIDFIKQERKMVSSLVEKLDRRFTVSAVEETKQIEEDSLSKPLLNEKHFIDWQKKKEEQVKDTYDFVRYKYSKMMKKIKESKTPLCYSKPTPVQLEGKEKTDMEKFSLRYPCKFKNFTYNELTELEKKAEERKKTLLDTEWSKKYMDNLYARINKKADSEEFQKQMTNAVSSAMWDSSIGEEESELDRGLAKKVMKLSQYEKQMCTQIMETKQQARNLIKNRIEAEKEFSEEREHQFNCFFDNLKDQLNMELVDIDFDTRRQNMLHKTLYAEKIKRKRAHYYEICYDTMLSIVDYATRYAYFKRLFEGDIPEHFIHEWKNLYYKQQPIFDILDKMEDLIKEHDIEEETDQGVEDIFTAEYYRQDVLNDCEFNEYHNYLYPWNLELLIPNYDPESEDRKLEYLGNRILGHIVYTLYEIKYPYPAELQPADLSQFTVKALVRGIPDRAITIPMQNLLNFRNVHVVRLEAAIIFCLRQFKVEMVGCTDIDLSFDKYIAVAENENEKELLRAVKNEDDSTFKVNDSMITSMLGVSPPNVKQTQTPKQLPEEDITLSAPANLGHYAYEALSSGDSLTDYLICAMLVEYIKNQKDVQGFVIVNYPNTYREASILEETFAGHSPPDEAELNEDHDDIYLEETISKNRKRITDPYEETRSSKLVSDPHKKRINKPFASYFTSYIKLIETQDILQELVIWDLDEENSELIDRFYAALGMNYSMYYEYFEKDFLSQLCKYIIGDFATPLKSTNSLFGDHVLSLLEFPSTEDKRLKHKMVKPEVVPRSKDKIRSKIDRSNEEIEGEFQFKHDTTPTGEEEEEEIPIQSVSTLEEAIVLAGEVNWNYGELPIANKIGVAMASCWEEIEKTYILDIKDLFLAKRMQMNCLIPYTRFIKDKMEQIITLPCNKQDLVYKFQKQYNDFEDDWRPINLSKNEWHCRIKDFQHKLCDICDQRKIFAERMRQSLICDNWAAEELITMYNTYISLMQVEINRSILTHQTAHDFYFSMLKNMPPTERLSPKELVKVFRDSEETSGSRKGGEDKVYRQLKIAFQELQMKNITIDYSNNPLNMLIEHNVKLALKIIKELNEHYRTLISREYSDIAKLNLTIKKKDPDAMSEESQSPEEILKQNALKCIDEWLMGINGEMSRIHLRLQALQHKCLRDLKLFNDVIYKAFNEIQERINSSYTNEIKSVDRLCKYFQMAVESGKKIQETVIIDQEDFIIDPNVLQFTDKDDENKETKSSIEWEFKTGQLARLRSQFKIVAPTGLALQQAFIYCLQDFVLFGKESCDGPLFPEIWKKVDPEKIPKLVYNLFSDTAYVDWRDFLIMALNIRYPTIDELLEIRKRFRCNDKNSIELISRDNYLNEKLWFEADFGEDQALRGTLVKHFLFELFETSENFMNYTAFLLAFCKNVDPVEGFTNALSMAIGKKCCHIIDECEEVVCKLIKDKVYRDECHASAVDFVVNFIETAIQNAVAFCTETTLFELPPDVESKSKIKTNKQGKQSHGAKNAQRSTQSLNEKKSKRCSSSNKSPIVTTYICPPCQDQEVEDKILEEIVVEEEEPSPIPDPEIAYTIDQSSIWKILRICLPWHFEYLPEVNESPYIDLFSATFKKLEKLTDEKDIYICKMVSDAKICKFLHKAKKFTELNLIAEIHKLND